MSRTNGRAAPLAAALAMAALTILSACGRSQESPPPAAAETPAPAYALGALRVEHPWSRPAAAGMNGVGYLTVVNTGDEEDRLIAIETGAAKSVQLHRTTMTGGVMSMGPVEAVALPAGGRVELAPGGLHVMLMGLTAPLKAGDSVPATLVFEKAGRLEAAFAVEGAAAPAMDDHMGH